MGLQDVAYALLLPSVRVDLGWSYAQAGWLNTANRVGYLMSFMLSLILDMVGGDYIPRNIKSLAKDGRLVQIAFLQGANIKMNFAEIMTRRLTITGSTLRPQSDLAKAKIADSLQKKVWPLLETGRLQTVIDNTFDLQDASKAHARMESGAHIGKIVLKIS